MGARCCVHGAERALGIADRPLGLRRLCAPSVRQVGGTRHDEHVADAEHVRERPPGHLFNTITHGIRTMAAYGPQIPPNDRWAIIAYIQALQLSRNAAIDDVPPQERDRLR